MQFCASAWKLNWPDEDDILLKGSKVLAAAHAVGDDVGLGSWVQNCWNMHLTIVGRL